MASHIKCSGASALQQAVPESVRVAVESLDQIAEEEAGRFKITRELTQFVSALVWK